MNQEFQNDEQEAVALNGKKLSLNFTDKDEKENAKFNDARLVDILRNYPLLYNKSLESFGDPDYTQWMWGEIAHEMNDVHRKTTLNLPFTWTNCREQWEIIKRALRYLSNPAAKSFRYPKNFRECLEFFQNYIRDRRELPHTDRSQDLFTNHTILFEQLPFEKQLALERDLLNVVLLNELEFCAPLVDPEVIENQACEEFGKVMALLMPEVDVHMVQNELATESESFTIDDLLKKSEIVPTEPTMKTVCESANEPVANVQQLLDMYTKGDNSLKPTAGFQLVNLLGISSDGVNIAKPDLDSEIQYAVQEVIQEGTLQDDLQNVIEEDVIEEDIVTQDDLQVDNTQEVVLQECVFQDHVMQEDLIEEVVPHGPGKDMPSLDIDGQFEEPVNRMDFACVLNEMLK